MRGVERGADNRGHSQNNRGERVEAFPNQRASNQNEADGQPGGGSASNPAAGNQGALAQNVDGGDIGAHEGNDEAAGGGAGGNNPEQNYVTMKKSKKFIKFKDYIIKLPNSMGLIGSRNQAAVNMNNDLGPFVECPRDENEGPGGSQQVDSFYGFNTVHMHPNMRLRDKGYSIYVVDDEHEIHRFDIDTYEWTIISTTKD